MKLTIMIVLCLVWPLFWPEVLQAEECISAITRTNRRGRMVTRLRTITRADGCRRREVPALTGPVGPRGRAGQDGSIRVYGDGSAGPLNVTATTNWHSNPPAGANLQFTDCTVAAGVALWVPSGTIIRCTGSASIQGTIVLHLGVLGGYQAYAGTIENSVNAMFVEAPAGISTRGAGIGQFRSSDSGGNNGMIGGRAGIGLANDLQATFMTKQYLYGGGGGAPAVAGSTQNFGAGGGGAVGIYAKETISIAGTINAKGSTATSSGCGGGGGGVVVLASQSAISFSGGGKVDVSGGNGGPSSSRRGAGGGGGGGIIVYAAPSVPTVNAANSVVTGGTAGSNATNVTLWPRQAGGGGGGSGGDGGGGGNVLNDGTASPALSGTDGRAVELPYDPTSVIF